MNGRPLRLLPFLVLPALLPTFPVPGLKAAAQARAGADRLTLSRIQGRVEVQAVDLTWRPLDSVAVGVQRALRTGTGRATLVDPTGGRTVVGSSSRLRHYQGEPDLQAGQFVLDGPAAAFTRGSHLFVEAGSKVRVDLSVDGSTQRIAVIVGQVRLSNGPKLLSLTAGTQLDLKSFQQRAFTEHDPWYTSVFTGSGEAAVEALRGDVRWISAGGAAQGARVRQLLSEAQGLTTAENSWVEVGFTGGGYLRLAEQSELKVLAVERTARGREVTLQLLKGSAWNVVEKGQGGYRISTPVVSTAVRGTTFRVDASGLVKVMEGRVALPSQADEVVEAGQQKAGLAPVQPLVKDALDLLNEALDVQRAEPLQLAWEAWRRHQQSPAFTLRGSRDAVVSATLVSRDGQVTPLQVQSDMAAGLYRLAPHDLPDGRYTLRVQASRFGQARHWSRAVWIDRHPPELEQLHRDVKGRILTLTGRATDPGGAPLTLHVRGGGLDLVRTVPANTPFELNLPAPLTPGPLSLDLKDAAGNGAHAVLH